MITSSSGQEASAQIYLPKPTIQEGHGKQSSLTVDTAAFVSKGNGGNVSPPKFINTTVDTLGGVTISNSNINFDKDQILMTSVQRILNDINA